MTVKELIEKLKKYPEDLPVAVDSDIGRNLDDEIISYIDLIVKTWVHGNYPYNKEEFDYLSLE